MRTAVLGGGMSWRRFTVLLSGLSPQSRWWSWSPKGGPPPAAQRPPAEPQRVNKADRPITEFQAFLKAQGV